MLHSLTVAHFAPWLDAGFPVALPGGESVELRLIEAQPLGLQAHPDGGREPFSLVFLGPMRPRLDQRIHRLEHPNLGPLELFLVPIGPAGDSPGLRYQAIFA